MDQKSSATAVASNSSAVKKNRFSKLTKSFSTDVYKTLNEEISFEEYVERVYVNPHLVRNAFQRVYDMIMSFGTEDVVRHRKNLKRYKFFDATWHPTAFPIYGLLNPLDELVNFFRSAAGYHGTHKRVLLLHGPVGSSKSTICDILKKGLEYYSRTDEGAWYTFKWVNLPIEGEDSSNGRGSYMQPTPYNIQLGHSLLVTYLYGPKKLDYHDMLQTQQAAVQRPSPI